MSYFSPELAELYDLDCGDINDDIAFYQTLAGRTGGALLELGAGTGRVAIALAEAGLNVWGIDASEAMLARAACKAKAAATPLHLLPGRMERFKLDQQFGLIYAAFGTLHHLLSAEDQLTCLRCVERHLSPGGMFACDLRPLFFEDWEQGESVPLFHDWTRTHPSTGKTVMKFRTVRSDPARRVKHETAVFDIVSDDGSFRRVSHEMDFRFFGRDELVALLRESGLAVEGVYGSYELEPFDEAGDHLIVLARKLKGET